MQAKPPIRHARPQQASYAPRAVQTIEKTSKPIKAFQAVSVVLMLVCCPAAVIMLRNEQVPVIPVIGLLIGISGYLSARVLAWWNHG